MIIFGVTYYLQFVRNIIPPQTGWWQYMAWCMYEGDLPYKDFYLYVPPYFLLMTYVIYCLFGNHFIIYAIIGFLITRVLTWILLYKILTRILYPAYVAIGMITGICLTASYIADQVYDCNPLTMTLVVSQAYILLKISECTSDKLKNVFCLILGSLGGCLLMIKQNVGIFMPVAAICVLLLLLYYQNCSKKNCFICIIANILGFALAVMPGIVYLLYNNILQDFFRCIFGATRAKTAGNNIFLIVLENFMKLDYLVFSLFLILIIIMEKYLKKHDVKNVRTFSIILLILTTINLFIKNVYGLINYLGILKTEVYSFLVIISISSLVYICKETKKRHGKFLFISLLILFTFLLNCSVLLNEKWGVALYDAINFLDIKTKCLYISMYLAIFLWIFLAYKIFCGKRYQYLRLFGPFSIILLFLGVNLTSAELQELYALLLLPIIIAVLMQYVFHSDHIKNITVSCVCFLICFCCLSEKIYIPYDWHSWRVTSSYAEKDSSSVKGLEGYYLSKHDNLAYSEIIDLIEKNSKETDIVYQFPNIPLFNVLTKRKSVYAAIPYIDVCPDDIASQSAKELYQNNPKLVLYPEWYEDRWLIHEQIYRNGNRCGQREIQEFYNNIVKQTYRLLGTWENNSSENLMLWKRTTYHNGNPNSIKEFTNSKTFKQKVIFNCNTFNTFSLYFENANEMAGNALSITLKDLSTNEIVFENTHIINEIRNNQYYEVPLGDNFIDSSHQFEVKISINKTIKDGKIFSIGFHQTEETSNICFTFD